MFIGYILFFPKSQNTQGAQKRPPNQNLSSGAPKERKPLDLFQPFFQESFCFFQEEAVKVEGELWAPASTAVQPVGLYIARAGSANCDKRPEDIMVVR